MPSKDPERTREAARDRSRRWYEDNRERTKERSRQWREANPELKAEQNREYYAANREQLREQNRQYYSANRERRAEYNRQWNVENRERNTETNRLWRKANPERAAEHTKRWRAANPDRVRAQARKDATLRRARKRGVAYIERVDPLVVLESRGAICGICGETVDPLNFHVDHIVPLSKGGEHSYANTQPAHPSCNNSKGNKLPEACSG